MGVSVPVGVSLPAPGGRCSGPSGSPAQPGSGAELTPGIEPVSPTQAQEEAGLLPQGLLLL